MARGRSCDADVKGGSELRLVDAREAFPSTSCLKVASSSPTFRVVGSVEASHGVIKGS